MGYGSDLNTRTEAVETAKEFPLRQRGYHPTLGRFLQRDPLPEAIGEYVDGPNLYQYVQGRPTTDVDPAGLRPATNVSGDDGQPRPETNFVDDIPAPPGSPPAHVERLYSHPMVDFDFKPDHDFSPLLPSYAHRYDASSWYSDTMHLKLYEFYHRGNHYVSGDRGAGQPASRTPADYVILGGQFLQDVIGQSEQVDFAEQVQGAVMNDARKVLSKIEVGKTATFADRGVRLVTADFSSSNVRLSLQRYYVWWQVIGSVGPKQQHESMKAYGFDGKCGSTGNIEATIYWTLRDKYDFEGWEPYGWVGHPFFVWGEWSTPVSGTAWSVEGAKK